MVVTRESSGMERAGGDDELPIDIHYAQLNDWLVDRKKVAKDWRAKLGALHAKTAALARQIPPSLARVSAPGVVPHHHLEDGEASRWDYFRAVAVRDAILRGAASDPINPEEGEEDGRETNGDDPSSGAAAASSAGPRVTRGLFGRLAGKAKEWDDVVRAYERDGLHLPEAGLTLVQGVDYDVPYHRAQAAKRAKQLQDLDRREGEYTRSIAAAREKCHAACRDVGVPEAAAIARGGAGFAAHLARVAAGVEALHVKPPHPKQGEPPGQPSTQPAAHLDAVFSNAAEAARAPEVGEAVAHYAAWMGFAHRRKDATPEALLPSLGALRAYDANATIPAARGEDAGGVVVGEGGGGGGSAHRVEVPAGGIDWDIGGDPAGSTGADNGGAVGVVSVPAGGIDWDLGAMTLDAGASGEVDAPGGGGGIDWDLGDAVAAETGDGGGGGGIDWGIDVAEGGGGIDWGIDVAEDGASGGGGVAEIDWDIGDVTVEVSGGGVGVEVEASGDDAALDAAGGAGEASSVETSGDRPFYMRLEDRDFRAAVVDDLLELRAFLAQRASDLRGAHEATTLLSSAPPEVQSVAGADALTALAEAVQAPVDILRSDAARRLLLISTSGRYRERLAAELEAKAALEGKVLGALRELEEKRAGTRQSHARSVARAEALCQALREVKAAVEGIVSKQYKGRATNVIGQISNVLG